MKLPASVKIGNHIYKIRQVTELSDEHGKYMGWNERHKLDIAVEEALPDTVKLETTMHEIVHGLLNDTVFYGSKHNEAITVSLTLPILNFIVDNPEYIKFLQKEVKRVRGIQSETASRDRQRNQRRPVARPDTGGSSDSERSSPTEPVTEPTRRPRRSRNSTPDSPSN